MERLPDGARIEQGPGGLERLVLSASDGEAVVYLQGAHVAHFQPRGEKPVLWMSAESRFEAGKPIRGGVPICFPWFGPKAGAPDAPLHGFARILPWSIAAVTRESDGRLRTTLDLTSDAAARGGFPHELALSLTVRVGRSLRLDLAVRNTDTAPRAFEAALHSYFALSDVRHARIRGLEGVAYVDKTAGMALKPGASEPITIAAETDRVYLGATGTVTIEDPGWRRRVSSASRARRRRSSGTRGWRRRGPWPTSATRSGRGWSASRRRTPWATR